MINLAAVLAVGVLSGLLTSWIYRRFGNSSATRSAINRVLAHLMEFRLFIDEPALVLTAQKNLLRANFDVLRSLLRPTLILLLPFAMLAFVLDACFGLAPLTVGDPAVLTLAYRDGEATSVQGPIGILVETEGVRAPAMHQVSFRLRPLEGTTSFLKITAGQRTTYKRVVAGSGWPLQFPFTQTARLNYAKSHVCGLPWWIWYMLGLLSAGFLLPLQSML